MPKKLPSLKTQILHDQISINASRRESRKNFLLKNGSQIDNELIRARKRYEKLSKTQLLDLITEMHVKLILRTQKIMGKSAELDTLREIFDASVNKRLDNNKNRQVKTDKFSVHTKKQEIAKTIIAEMRSRLGTLTKYDAKDFYRFMNAECRRRLIGEPSKGTLATYFKNYAGIHSLK